MNKLRFLLLAGVLFLLAAGCRSQGGSGLYDVVVVGGGPAGKWSSGPSPPNKDEIRGMSPWTSSKSG